MTVEKALFLVDELKPNQIEKARKLEWLTNVDRYIFDHVIQTHEPDEDTPTEYAGYDQATEPDTELLVQAPFDELYRFYLEMHIDLANQEYDKYNNSAQLYANALSQYKRWYHREHRPRMPRQHLIFDWFEGKRKCRRGPLGH